MRDSMKKDSEINNDISRITFEELIVMPIEKRKILAHIIVETPGGVPNVAKVEGWGRFESFGEMSDEEILKEAKKIVKQMTLMQKVGQMTPNTTVQQYIPACLKYNDFPYIAGENKEFNIPGIKFSDGPAGVVMGNSSTCFPVSMARGATWDPALEMQVGETMGREARALGANLFGGVCINLLRHPAWGRSQETYGEDPFLLSKMGVAFVEGIQKHVMACVKHYALNSMENSRYKVNVDIDERSLRELYLPQFKACIDAGAAAVMSAYNQVRGSYCGESILLLRKILREEWGFKGIVISDFIHGLYDARKAVEAGLDIEMPIEGRYGKKLMALVEEGVVNEALIDESAIRILSTKMRFSKLAKSSEYYGKQSIASTEHVELARIVAQKSTVLLKNSNALLPLDPTKLARVVVVGPLATTANIGEMKGSSRVYPPYVITPLMGITNALPTGVILTYLPEIDDEQATQLIRSANAVIVVVGLTSNDEGEYIPHWNDGCGGDRSYLGLKESDLELIEKVASCTKHSIVVMQGGGAIITTPWDQNISALLMHWYPGMEGGNALADILFGKYNPSGKLPLTLPASAEQLPYFNKDADHITYDYEHGYFLADNKQYPVAYPFGFGLSYTDFSYSDLVVDESVLAVNECVRVAVTVTNSGTVAGEEVVQLYIGYQNSSVVRHKKDLRDFTRISLEPKERKQVIFDLPVKELAYWDTKGDQWIVEPLSYLVHVGSSSDDKDLLTATFRVR